MRFRAVLAPVLVVLLWATDAKAQPLPLDTCNLHAACQGESVLVTFEGYDVGGDPEHVGYDIYRREVGSCGEPSVEGFGIALEDFQLAPCTVSVAPSSWGNVKVLYR